MRRRAGRRQGGGDLAGDMAALAHAGDDHPAADGGDHRDAARETPVERRRQIDQGVGLGAQHAASGGERRVRRLSRVDQGR